MGKKIKICFIGRSKQIGGAELGLIDLIKNLDMSIFSVHIILPHKNSPNFQWVQKELPEIPLTHVPFEEYLPKFIWHRQQLPIYNPLGVLLLKRALRKIKPDLIHSNDLLAGKYGAKAAFSLNIPNIVMLRTNYYRTKFNYHIFVDRRLTKYASRIVSNSERGAELIFERTKAQNIMYINNGIDINKFDKSTVPVDFYEKNNIPRDKRIILLPARIGAGKGQHTLVSSLPYIVKEQSDIHVVFLGDCQFGNEDYFKSLKEEVNHLGLNKIVSWITFNSQVASFYKVAYVVVLPSFLEGAPRVLLEAMASSTPIIGSKIDGINEIIQDGVNGFKFELDQPKSLADAAIEIMRLNNSDYQGMKQRCKQIAVEKYDIKKMIKNYEKLYIELTSEADIRNRLKQ
jgi:glycosyltransferase involved in cell wall biosynthesis